MGINFRIFMEIASGFESLFYYFVFPYGNIFHNFLKNSTIFLLNYCPVKFKFKLIWKFSTKLSDFVKQKSSTKISKKKISGKTHRHFASKEKLCCKIFLFKILVKFFKFPKKFNLIYTTHSTTKKLNRKNCDFLNLLYSF